MHASPTPASLRAALARFATGVTIVTARASDGSPVGLTVNSFNSVSLNPPLVLWSLALGTTSMPTFMAGADFAIHVLSAQQRDLAERFATREVERWQGLHWREGLGGVPLLDGASALFECRQRSRYQEGDHVIFVGEVLRCSHQPQSAPLLYHGGRFYTEHPL